MDLHNFLTIFDTHRRPVHLLSSFFLHFLHTSN